MFVFILSIYRYPLPCAISSLIFPCAISSIKSTCAISSIKFPHALNTELHVHTGPTSGRLRKCQHCTAQYTLNTAHCTLHWSLNTKHCKLHTADCIMPTAHCTLYNTAINRSALYHTKLQCTTLNCNKNLGTIVTIWQKYIFFSLMHWKICQIIFDCQSWDPYCLSYLWHDNT